MLLRSSFWNATQHAHSRAKAMQAHCSAVIRLSAHKLHLLVPLKQLQIADAIIAPPC